MSELKFANRKYYLLDLERSSTSRDLIWWKPDNHGYTSNLDEAGKYDEETIKRNPSQYGDKDTKIVLCNEVDKVSERVVRADALVQGLVS